MTPLAGFLIGATEPASGGLTAKAYVVQVVEVPVGHPASSPIQPGKRVVVKLDSLLDVAGEPPPVVVVPLSAVVAIH